MKKTMRMILFIVAAAILCAAPLGSAPIKIFAAGDDTPYSFTAPAQSSKHFSREQISTGDITTWSATAGDFAIAQKLNTADFDNFVSVNKLKNNEYMSVSPAAGDGINRTVVALTQKNTNRAKAHFAGGDISLPANGYYAISVKYYILGSQPSYFYLQQTNGPRYDIPLGKQYVWNHKTSNYLDPESDDPTKSSWATAYFFIQTDILASATFTASVYLGSADSAVKGAAYYYDFKVEALSEGEFNAEFVNPETEYKYPVKIDLTNKDTEESSGFVSADKFRSIAEVENAHSITEIANSAIPGTLNFNKTHNYFHTMDGINGKVMLVSAEKSYAGIITTTENNFKPQPHEVYMIQFYSIGVADAMYFRMGDDYTSVNGADNKYHNGWQLSTFFYIGDAARNTEKDDYPWGFYIGRENEPATGWMAVSNIVITRVSGNYANANVDTAGVKLVNLNTRADSSFPNAYFDRGTAADIYVNGEANTAYPYPLTAESWTVNTTETDKIQNGIMNTHYASFGDIPNPDANKENNIYMMRNYLAVDNSVTGSSFLSAKYVSFDARVTAAAVKAKAVLKYNDMILGEIEINETNEWRTYEFVVTENEFASGRSYTLSFVISGVGAAFFDNVHADSTAGTRPLGQPKTSKELNLADPIHIPGIFTATFTPELNYELGADGILITNEGHRYTLITNNLSYAPEAGEDKYYKYTVTASGQNAYLYLDILDGKTNKLAVTEIKDPTDPKKLQLTEYSFYFINTDAASITFSIDLGVADETSADFNALDAYIKISSMTLEPSDAVEYNAAKDSAETDTKIKILSAAVTPEQPDEPGTVDEKAENDFFGKNWWYLIPTLITALAILTAVFGFLLRRLKFNVHITKKGTSYARDLQIEKAKKNIKAVKAVKKEKVDEPAETVDNNITDDTQNDK